MNIEISREDTTNPRTIDVIFWLSLAAAASGLLLSTTNHMCQDTAIIPLLWVVPLSLYLLTFILCFEYGGLYKRWLFPPLFAGSVIFSIVTLFIGLKVPLVVQIAADAAVLLTGCMVCHGELARAKPKPKYLTKFYLAVATGGALGGLSVAIVAPRAFNGFWEFHIGLFAATTMFLVALMRDRSSFLYKRPIIIGTSLGVFLIILGGMLIHQIFTSGDDTIFVTRNFYGILRVEEDRLDHTLKLLHGRISHGFQYVDSARASIPTTYYTRESGIGLAIDNHPRRDQGLRIGVVGLGVGTIAAYGQRKDTIRFYEINPAVLRLSNSPGAYFTYLERCKGHIEVALGDARLTLEEELRDGKRQMFDVLAVDAFSSDAIPVHLLTREAFELYLHHLRFPDGILAIHISNRYLNLVPVVKGIADFEGLQSIFIYASDTDDGGFSSDWILLSPSATVLSLDPFTEAATSWDSTGNKKIRLWTDGYSNLISVLK